MLHFSEVENPVIQRASSSSVPLSIVIGCKIAWNSG